MVVGEPDLADPPTALEFGEVPIGRGATLRLELHNEGIGDLTLGGAYSGHSSIDLFDVPALIEAGSSGEVLLTFTPEAEGAHEGTLLLDTNDADWPRITLPVAGTGVSPRLEITPGTLWFGEVAPGESVTRVATLSSAGSGRVTLTDIVFPAGEGEVYSWALPGDQTVPLVIEPGYALSLSLTYSPTTDGDVSGELVLASDDIVAPNQAIKLLAGAGTGGAQPPDVEIVTPGWGTAWLDSEAVLLGIQAVDPDDAPENLTVLVYVDGALETVGSPDADGNFGWTLGALPAGKHTVLARAIDPAGGIDEDTVELDVQSEDDLTYTISGGESIFEYWSVDDDVKVWVDGALVFDDSDEHQSTHAPLEIEAVRGSTIRVVATDANTCRKLIDDLVLHFGTDRSQPLLTGLSASACPADADYDETYDGPWPNDFVDVEVTVSIP